MIINFKVINGTSFLIPWIYRITGKPILYLRVIQYTYKDKPRYGRKGKYLLFLVFLNYGLVYINPDVVYVYIFSDIFT